MRLAELFDMDEPEWKASAACSGRMDLFFARDQISERIAVAICRTCPVCSECLDEALATEALAYRYGVRGGLTATERKRLDR